MGIWDGFSQLMQGRKDRVRLLTMSDIAMIHAEGGSILRTSRANPTTNPDNLATTIRMLRELEVSYLVSIGGEDTALSTSDHGER